MAYQIKQLESLDDKELRLIAEELNIEHYDNKSGEDLIYAILDRQAAIEAGIVKPTRKRKRITVAVHDEAVYTADKSGGARKLETEEKTALRKTNTNEEVESAVAEVKETNPQEEAEKEEKIVVKKTRKKTKATKKESTKSQKEEVEPTTDVADTDSPSPEADKETDTEVETSNPIKEEPQEEVEEKHDNELPDFLIEQIAKDSEKVDEEDFEKVKRSLEKNISDKETIKKETPENEIAHPDVDFIVIKDVPVVANIPQVEDFNTASNTSKFRRIKDETSTQHTKIENNINNAPHPEDIFINGNGVLEIVSEGYGFLRSSDYNYLTSPDDVYVSNFLIKQKGLKNGDIVEGKIRIPRRDDKFYVLEEVTMVNGVDPKIAEDRVTFEHLTPLFPEEKFTLCSEKGASDSCRVVDMFSPIGKGQRALIVAQPKTGKTWLMKDIANAIARNHPEAYLMMLLIDERPEEVTDMQRTVDAEVIASTFDESAQHHVKIANIVLDKAKRMVECGHDVVIFLDSITRLARAYNTVSPSSGKVLSGGVEANSLQHPKRFFGAARNIEGGGSLTIIATALIDTGSKMDEVIFEEFKGTGNMELQLDRNLANKRIYPAVNLVASSTRRDDLLLDEMSLNRMWILRKFIADMNPLEAMTELKRRMKGTKNNDEFLMSMNG